MHLLPFLNAFVPGLTVLIGYWIGGVGLFFTPLWMLPMVAVLDAMQGQAPFDPAGDPVGDGAGDGAVSPAGKPGYSVLAWAVLPAYGALLGWALWVVATAPLSPLETAGLLISMGFAGGSMAITTAHELVHRPRAGERAVGLALLALVNYMHFRIEHVHNHHRWVGTPRDPATARFGESLYAFFLRSLPRQHASAWRLEAARLRRRGMTLLHPRNRMLWYLAIPAGLALAIGLGLGWGAALFYLVHGLMAALLLEIINYLEHYGLERRRLAPAPGDPAGAERYEPMGPRHSWNTNSRATNWGLLNLGRHSDHHMAVERPYQKLRNSADMPQLPAGYPAMFMVALVPPLWRRIMDRRALAWRQGDLPAPQPGPLAAGAGG